jgi:hypothetical protein
VILIPHWTLTLALAYIRHLQPTVMDAGWCLTLAGGVLNRGEGKDLDLVAYPRTASAVEDDLLFLLPQDGVWSDVLGVSRVYTYRTETRHEVDLIFPLRAGES